MVILIEMIGENMARKGRQRLTIDIPISVYEQLKYIKQKYNITFTRYLLRIILEKLAWEKQFE